MNKIMVKTILELLIFVLLVAVTFSLIKASLKKSDESLFSDSGSVVESTYEDGIDLDSDGIPNSEEKEFGTNHEKSDTDNDGLSDWYEINEYYTDPLLYDSDSDGVSDGAEIRGNAR